MNFKRWFKRECPNFWECGLFLISTAKFFWSVFQICVVVLAPIWVGLIAVNLNTYVYGAENRALKTRKFHERVVVRREQVRKIREGMPLQKAVRMLENE